MTSNIFDIIVLQSAATTPPQVYPIHHFIVPNSSSARITMLLLYIQSLGTIGVRNDLYHQHRVYCCVLPPHLGRYGNRSPPIALKSSQCHQLQFFQTSKFIVVYSSIGCQWSDPNVAGPKPIEFSLHGTRYRYRSSRSEHSTDPTHIQCQQLQFN